MQTFKQYLREDLVNAIVQSFSQLPLFMTSASVYAILSLLIYLRKKQLTRRDRKDFVDVLNQLNVEEKTITRINDLIDKDPEILGDMAKNLSNIVGSNILKQINQQIDSVRDKLPRPILNDLIIKRNELEMAISRAKPNFEELQSIIGNIVKTIKEY